jgi:magnesium-transporting ATPase (P-type)
MIESNVRNTPQELLSKYNDKKLPLKEQRLLRDLSSRAVKPGASERFFQKNRISTSKYTAWNFIFINMAEQFSKVGNVYFLFLALLQLVPAVSITDGVPTILFPLIFIIIVTAVKDILEDLQRHSSDTKENTQLAEIYADQFGNTETQNLSDFEKEDSKPWQDLYVGNVIRVNKYFFICLKSLGMDFSPQTCC